MSNGVFLSWAPFSRRTATLAARFGLTTRHVTAPWFMRPALAPLKYPLQFVRSVRMLIGERPREVWVQDPPTPAVAAGALYCLLARRTLVIDMHTVGFYDPKWRLMRVIEWPLLKLARVNLVTNSSLARRVDRWRCRSFVLPDPLPQAPRVDAPRSDSPYAVVVATYSPDEPIELLPLVAAELEPLEVYVTGRPRVDTRAWPVNLLPTGFLGDRDYWSLLSGASVVVVLTTRPDTLLSGGYEAMALGRALVVSDQDVLREYYGEAAVFVQPTPHEIGAGIRVALERVDELEERIRLLRQRRTAEWDDAARLLAAVVGRE